jgi:hypothetical protein
MSEGNYLRKARKNFFISADCIEMMEDLSRYEGLNHSGVIEQAVRAMFEKRMGPRPKPDKPVKLSCARPTHV